MATCKSCRARTEWLFTADGNRVMVDPEYWWMVPGEGQTMGITDDGRLHYGLKLGNADDVPLNAIRVRTDHLRTCPHAFQGRGRRS